MSYALTETLADHNKWIEFLHLRWNEVEYIRLYSKKFCMTKKLSFHPTLRYVLVLITKLLDSGRALIGIKILHF